MKIDIQRSEERGKDNYGWLKTRYSFSFNTYHNPNRMDFGALRVLNDDVIQGGGGFGTHPHENMEIISIVTEGALEHKDDMGNFGVIPAGYIQRISAGTGINHSEFNHSKTENVHLFQIWIHPKENGTEPSYEQKQFSTSVKKNKLLPVVSCDGDDNALYIHQDAVLSLGELDQNVSVKYNMRSNQNGVYVFIIRGEVKIGNDTLSDRDAAGITEVNDIEITAIKPSYVLVIEVPMD